MQKINHEDDFIQIRQDIGLKTVELDVEYEAARAMPSVLIDALIRHYTCRYDMNHTAKVFLIAYLQELHIEVITVMQVNGEAKRKEAFKRIGTNVIANKLIQLALFKITNLNLVITDESILCIFTEACKLINLFVDITGGREHLYRKLKECLHGLELHMQFNYLSILAPES